MAMRPCRECKKEVSTAAKACPHCGCVKPTKPPWALPAWVAFPLVFVIWFWIRGGAFEPRPTTGVSGSSVPAASYRYAVADLNVRAAPGTESPVAGRLETGERVRVGETAGGWTVVLSQDGNDVLGYASNSYLSAEPTAPPFAEIRDRMRQATEAQWNQYATALRGASVEWTGWVDEVNEKLAGGYEVWIDMDPPGSMSVLDVLFDVDAEVALELQKDQRVSFSGRIEAATNVVGALQIRLRDARISPR